MRRATSSDSKNIYEELRSHIKEIKKKFPGWSNIIDSWNMHILTYDLKAFSISEENGGLLLVSFGNYITATWTPQLYTDLSLHTCCKCGSIGEQYIKNDNILTMCLNCAMENDYSPLPSDQRKEFTIIENYNGFNFKENKVKGLSLLATILLEYVRRTGHSITSFRVKHGRLCSTYDTEGDYAMELPLDAITKVAEDLSSRICSDCGRMVTEHKYCPAPSAALTLLGIRNYKNSALNAFPRDVLRLIGKEICKTKLSPEWLH
ncbi:hypothetical protein Indivirus_11_12 [Indivirus ILV1]|uniref:Uncharacterized protein n=1 Tax=Indivirus ILV1 TaxID=1977633 RepID=A0A1V0SEJ6_9VIRU|nr:hypothetical protein Indivirus_11_12 [Indivirus ILV1]